MKTLTIKTNKSGNKVALVKLNNGGFLVYIQKVNYSHGRDVAKWFICNLTQKQEHNDFQKMAKKGLEESVATTLFNKKSK